MLSDTVKGWADELEQLVKDSEQSRDSFWNNLGETYEDTFTKREDEETGNDYETKSRGF